MPALATTASMPAGAGHRGHDRRRERRLVGDVALVPAGVELGRERREPIGLQASQEHSRPAGGRDPGHVFADAARGAGDEDGLSTQARHWTASTRGRLPVATA